MIITVGVLFLLHQMRSGYFDFSNTWPILLIVAGAITLASSTAPMTGHIEPGAPATPAVPPINTVAPGTPQNPLPGQGQ